tara:strand:- start:2940 stop:3290 length:351 start_codon:yes stop_codon:yes gene_type:complete
MKYNLNLNSRKGFLSNADLTIEVNRKFREVKNEYMKTEYALLLLSIDDEFRTLGQLRKMANPFIDSVGTDAHTTFLLYLEELGYIESQKNNTRHRSYRRVTRKELSLRKLKSTMEE